MAKVEWDADKALKAIGKAADEGVAAVAKDVKQRAKALCPRDTGQLRDSIRISKSKYKDGGYIVYAGSTYKQNPTYKPGVKTRNWKWGAYYAYHVETGTPKMEARPYLRPAARAVARNADRKIGDKIAKAIK